MKMRAFLFVKAALLSLPAIAQTRIDGVTSVIDSIEIHGQCIRLHGFDARESSQLCTRSSGEHWRCRQQAALALADQIRRSVIFCDPRYRDRSRRIVAACLKVTLDLNRWMVTSGWAVAFRRYSLRGRRGCCPTKQDQYLVRKLRHAVGLAVAATNAMMQRS